jgi:hypothetical protein
MEMSSRKVWAVENKTTGDWIKVKCDRDGLPVLNRDGFPTDGEGRVVKIQNVDEVKKQLSSKAKT